MNDYLITLKDGRIVQVNDTIGNIAHGGAIGFVRYPKTGPSYQLCAFAPGTWLEVNVMSQATGHANGYEVIKRGKK